MGNGLWVALVAYGTGGAAYGYYRGAVLSWFWSRYPTASRRAARQRALLLLRVAGEVAVWPATLVVEVARWYRRLPERGGEDS